MVDELAREIEQQILRGVMLGVLDVDWEVANEDKLEHVGLADPPRPEATPTSHAPFAEAVKAFRERQVMPRPAFDLLEGAARRKAFTVARMARQDLLDAAHAELARQLSGKPMATRKDPDTGKWIYEGPNLREFQEFAKERLESAGWTPANPSHVETVYRTNVMSAYATGRVAQMRAPAVLAAMPYWQIRGVGDDRQRPTHKRANGVILPANHPFWKKAYPPFGYNCRCRVVARSARWVQANNATIGPPPDGLPDPGFESGLESLPQIPTGLMQQAQEPTPQPRPVAVQSGPLRPPGGIPVQLPPMAPPPPPAPPPAPPPPPPRRPVDRQTFEALGIEFRGSTTAERDQAHARFMQSADHVFGKPMDPQHVLRILGVNHVPGKAVVSVAGTGTELMLNAEYTDATGAWLASVNRHFTPGTGGARVYHALFEIEEKHQGKGIAKAMFREAFREYQQLGVKTIDVTAAWEGRYTWSRMGFRYVGSRAEFDSLKRRFATWLTRNVPNVDQVGADAIVQHIGSMHDLAVTRVDGFEAGKAFLPSLPRGEMFPMTMELDPSDPGFKIAVQYLGL